MATPATKQQASKPRRKAPGTRYWRTPDALWAEIEPLLPPASRTHWGATTRA